MSPTSSGSYMIASGSRRCSSSASVVLPAPNPPLIQMITGTNYPVSPWAARHGAGSPAGSRSSPVAWCFAVCLPPCRAAPRCPGVRTPTFALRSAGGRAVTASPSRVLGEGVPQVAAVDFWPEASGEEQFGVRGVPGQKVGRALLGAGPPQQVHVGQVGQREAARDLTLCDLFGVEVAREVAARDCG